MTESLRIDFVSDLSCPWCAIGLHALERALANLAQTVTAELRFQPFELNPGMAPEGQDMAEHLAQKYGATPEQQAQLRETIRRRGAEAGFSFNWPAGMRIYNTLDAHRLLHWAGLPDTEPGGRQGALKKALFTAYFSRGEALAAPDVLLGAVAAAGLDPDRARAVLATDAYAAEVRRLEAAYAGAGISSVPAVIVERRYLITGGQPVAVFEAKLEQIFRERAGGA